MGIGTWKFLAGAAFAAMVLVLTPEASFSAPEVKVTGNPQCYQTFYIQDLGSRVDRKPAGTPLAGGGEKASFLLKYARQPGEKYVHQQVVEAHFSAGPLIKKTFSNFTMLLREFELKDRLPNGDFAVSASVMRLLKAIVVEGKPQAIFDSGYDEQLKAARDDPNFPTEYRAALPLLDLSYSYTLAASGDLYHFKVDHPDANYKAAIAELAERDIAGRFTKLPGKAVPIGASWPSGRKVMDLPGIGTIGFSLTGRLAGVQSVPDLGDVAIIELSPDQTEFTPAAGGKITFTSVDVKVRFVFAFSLKEGDVLYQHAISALHAKGSAEGKNIDLETCVVLASAELKPGTYAAKGTGTFIPRVVVLKLPDAGEYAVFSGK